MRHSVPEGGREVAGAVTLGPLMASQETDAARAYCEIVALLLICDAAVTDAERVYLDGVLDRFGLEGEDRSAVLNAVDIGAPVAPRVARLDDEGRATILEELERAAASDGDHGAREAQIVAETRKALGV